MRRTSMLLLLVAVVAMLFAPTVMAGKPPPKVLTADICDNSGSGFQVFWIRYSYSGFKHAQIVGSSIQNASGEFDSSFGLAPGAESGSGVMAFSWGGVVVTNDATAMRAVLYANSLNKTIGESAWIPIADNSIGGLSNNGWPPC